MEWLVRKLMALMPSEAVGARDIAAVGRLFVCSSVGLGCYWAWLFLTCFSTLLFEDATGFPQAPQISQFLSYTGYIVVLAISLAFVDRISAISRSRVGMALVAGGTCVMTFLLSVSSALPSSFAIPIIAIASVVCGLCTGIYLVTWGAVFSRRFVFAPLQLAVSLLVSALVCAISLIVSNGVGGIVASLLPVAYGVLCVRSRELAETAGFEATLPDEEGKTHAEQIKTAFPWRPCFALLLLGVLCGMLFGLAFRNVDTGYEIAWAFAFANMGIGLVVIIYTFITRQNFGFSSAYMMVLSLSVVALLVFALYGIEAVFIAILFARAAYVIFDVMTWAQIPKIFAKKGNIRTFVVSRVALEGGFGVGLTLYSLVLAGQWLLFDAVFLVVGALLSVALMLAFSNSSVENAWGLLPPAKDDASELLAAAQEIGSEHKLTPREQEIMTLIMRGKNGPYIQDKLCITQNTYQTHTRNIYHKLGVHSRQEVLQLLDDYLSQRKASGDTFPPKRKIIHKI